MWLFGRSRKTESKCSQPVQRQISIRTRDEQDDLLLNDGQDQLNSFNQRTTGLDSSLHGSQLDHEDDDTESTSTSVSGSHFGARPRDNRSRSYNMEPLDTRMWSNVTSPGFTTRIVQQANGTADRSPLRDITGSRSPFSRSPNGSLRLGQLPISAVPKRTASSLINFPSPRGTSLFTFGRFSRISKRDRGGNGTVFVKLAPVDLKGSAPSVTPIASGSGSGSPGTSGFQGFNEPISPGLGGIPQSGLTQRFSRLWQNKSPTKYAPNSGYPQQQSQSHGPSVSNSILDALNTRKRTRDLDLSLSEPNKVSRPQSTSTPIMSPDDANKHSKRVKYVNEQDIRLNRPLTFDHYQDMSSSGNEPLTSKSILEQMNQTEKRFFPDSTPVTSAPKRTKIIGSPRGSSTPIFRKRKGDNGISVVEFDKDDEISYNDPKSKTGKFCHCNECYAEAAGVSNNSQTSPIRYQQQQPSFVSTPASYGGRKMVTFDESSFVRPKLENSMCDKGTETDLLSNVVVRKATQSGGYITKEKYEYDRVKRLERFRRILGLTQNLPSTSEVPSISGDQPDATNPPGSHSLHTHPSGQPNQASAVSTSSAAASTSGEQPDKSASLGAVPNLLGSPASGQTGQLQGSGSGGFNFGSQVTAPNPLGRPASGPDAAISTSSAAAASASGEQSDKSASLVSVPVPNPIIGSPASGQTGQLQGSGGFNFGAQVSVPNSIGFKPPSGQLGQPGGGFNFSAQSASPNSFGIVPSSQPGSQMFSLGTTPTTTAPPVASPNLFGNTSSSQPPTTTAAQVPSANLFGNAPLSQPTTTTAPQVASINLFGNAPSLHSGSQMCSLGTAPTTTAPAAASPNLFGNTPSSQSGSQVFGLGTTPTTTAPPVASPNLFGNTSSSQPPTTTAAQVPSANLFGNAPLSQPTTTTAPQVASINLFGNVPSLQPTTNTPSQVASTNLFGNVPSSQPTTNTPSQAANPNPFGSAPPSQPGSKMFEAPTNTASQVPSPNLFGSAPSSQPGSQMFNQGTPASIAPQAKLEGSGGFSFGSQASVQNPLGKPASGQLGQGGGFNFSTQTACPNPFGSAPSSQPSSQIFGVGTPANAAPQAKLEGSGGFSFGSQFSAPNPLGKPTSGQLAQPGGGFNFSAQSATPNIFGSAPSTQPSQMFSLGTSTNTAPQAKGSGGFTFGSQASVPNPLARPASGQLGQPGGGFNFSTQAATPNPFGSAPSSQPTSQMFSQGTPAKPSTFETAPISGDQPDATNSGSQSSNINSSVPPNQTAGGFNFGTPSLASNSNLFGNTTSGQLGKTSGGFNFGSQASIQNPFGTPAPGQTVQPQVSGGFNFASQASNPNPFGAPASGQLGQPGGGFNFSAQAASPNPFGVGSAPSPQQGSQMFSLGTPTNTASRRRAATRRYR